MMTAIIGLGLLVIVTALALVTRTAGATAGASGGGDLPCVDRVVWSPHRSQRGSKKVTCLIWHYTAGFGAVEWFANPEAKASAHFVIKRNGEIIQCVPLAESAWHAGDADVSNASSIGVEVENVGRVEPDGKGGWTYGDKHPMKWKPDAEPKQATLRYKGGTTKAAWWVPYTPAQVGAIARLEADLGRSIWRACVLDQRGHEDVARPEGRKTDPGPVFPWRIIDASKQHNRTTQVV
jgi:N-acetylmuramoyl-L-alanine amidase